MNSKIAIGSSPYEEDVVQLGTPDYEVLAKRELEAFKGQCLRHYKQAHGEDFPGTLLILPQHHDFGVYYELFAVYDAGHIKAEEAALWLEGHVPAEWDALALEALGIVRP